MCRWLWQTPAALTLISTCVPDGCGVGWSTSLSGALNSATWKLFIVSLPAFLFLKAIFGRTLPRLPTRDKRAERAFFAVRSRGDGKPRVGGARLPAAPAPQNC